MSLPISKVKDTFNGTLNEVVPRLRELVPNDQRRL